MSSSSEQKSEQPKPQPTESNQDANSNDVQKVQEPLVPEPSGELPTEPEIVLPSAILDKIPEEDRESVTQAIQEFIYEEFSSPLPPPHILRAYDELQPGTTNKIIEMAEKEQNFRHGIVRAELRNDYQLQLLGIIFGFIIVLVIVVGSVLAILQGRDVAGFGLVITAAAGLAGIFYYSRRAKKKRDQKDHDENEKSD